VTTTEEHAASLRNELAAIDGTLKARALY